MTSPLPNSPEYASAPTGAPADKKTLSIVSLVLGGVSILLSFFLPYITILSAIAGLIVGILARKREPGARGLSLAGIITSAIGIVLSIALLIFTIVLVGAVLNSGTVTP